MIIAQLRGGLGNQMFQYAAGRALSLRHGVPLKLDLPWFSSIAEGGTRRTYMLGKAFSIASVIASPEECDFLKWRKEAFVGQLTRRLLRRPKSHAGTYISEPHYDYWPGFEGITVPAYLFGYWQNERYFIEVQDQIRRDFTFLPFPAETEGVASSIRQSSEPVAVHIRRGDYESNPRTNAVHGLCLPSYYCAALKTVAATTGNPLLLFIFSDDPEWVRNNFDTLGFPVTVVDFPAHRDEPWHDMHLMSLCKHHIIANSSFSWWGTWLSGELGMVCAPRQWFKTGSNENDSPVPDRWIKI
ncbi:MAG: alpha-1,2-fucosyltransferase [Desulfovibrio sp.]|jgi:hypothetical protein|nr:alpha-1,2-fucosyltransferase [Desulfovibrio sp.]